MDTGVVRKGEQIYEQDDDKGILRAVMSCSCSWCCFLGGYSVQDDGRIWWFSGNWIQFSNVRYIMCNKYGCIFVITR